MLLSEMIGVESDTDFGVEGYYGKFRVRVNTGYEFLVVSDGKGAYDTVVNGATVYGIIAAAPANIIHLPPPLTDEQREQLKALYTLTFRWIVKNKKGAVIAYSHKPCRYDEYWATEKVDANIQSVAKELSVCSLVSWFDHEPFDIAKALGVEG